MSYDMRNSEVKNPTPRVIMSTPCLLRARSGVGGLSFSGVGEWVARATVRTAWQSTTGGREGG